MSEANVKLVGVVWRWWTPHVMCVIWTMAMNMITVLGQGTGSLTGAVTFLENYESQSDSQHFRILNDGHQVQLVLDEYAGTWQSVSTNFPKLTSRRLPIVFNLETCRWSGMLTLFSWADQLIVNYTCSFWIWLQVPVFIWQDWDAHETGSWKFCWHRDSILCNPPTLSQKLELLLAGHKIVMYAIQFGFSISNHYLRRLFSCLG